MPRTLFRLQDSYARIYRVGEVIANRPECEFQTIQSAIDQAVADGYTSNDNPALIEIYQKDSAYAENLTLYPGVHLAGVAGNQRFGVVIAGNLSYTPPAGTRAQNRLKLFNLSITGAAGGNNLDLLGTNQFEIYLENCLIVREGFNDGFICINKTNTQVSGNARLFLINSQVYFTDTVNPNLNVVEWNGGRFRIFGNQSSLGSDLSSVNSIIRFSGNSQFLANQNSSDLALLFGDGQNLIDIDTGLGSYAINTSGLTNYGGGNIIKFSQSATFTIRNTIISLSNTSAKLAEDGGSSGTLIIGNCSFNTPTGVSVPNVGLSYIDPTLNIGIDINRLQISRNGNQTIAYVGAGGFDTIQNALDWLSTANTLNPVLKIAPGNYDEDLVIPTINGTLTVVGDTEVDAVASRNGLSGSNTVYLLSNISLDTTTLSGIDFYNIFCQARDGNPLLTIGGADFTKVTFNNCYILSSDANATPAIIFDSTNDGNEELIFNKCRLERNGTVNCSFIQTNVSTSKYISFNLCNTLVNAQPSNNGLTETIILDLINANINIEIIDSYFNGSSSKPFSIGLNNNLTIQNSNFNMAVDGGELFYYLDAGQINIFNSYITVGIGEGNVIARDGLQADAQISLTGNVYGGGDGYDVNGTTFVNGVDFAVGATTADTANNIAAAINAAAGAGDPNLQNKIYAKVNGTDVNLYSVTFTTASNSYTLANIGTPPATITGWANGLDGNGGTYSYASMAMENDLVQSSITVTQRSETVVSF